eukprot:969589-Rhodomonas_salina.3
MSGTDVGYAAISLKSFKRTLKGLKGGTSGSTSPIVLRPRYSTAGTEQGTRRSFSQGFCVRSASVFGDASVAKEYH